MKKMERNIICTRVKCSSSSQTKLRSQRSRTRQRANQRKGSNKTGTPSEVSDLRTCKPPRTASNAPNAGRTFRTLRTLRPLQPLPNAPNALSCKRSPNAKANATRPANASRTRSNAKPFPHRPAPKCSWLHFCELHFVQLSLARSNARF